MDMSLRTPFSPSEMFLRPTKALREIHLVSLCTGDRERHGLTQTLQALCQNFLQEVDINDDEAFTQVKVSIQIASTPGSSWFTNRTLIHDSTIRLPREWLDRRAGELLWLDDAKSFGLHVQCHPKQVPEPAEGTSYYDLEVDGKCILTKKRK